ncbi:MAG: hypothetical protein ACJA02_000476 [Myxococcota bacterium]|jgi:hypothetical protein
MIRSIVSKLIILLIVLFSALSIFWFFKTSSLKKYVTSLVISSEGSVLASAISVTGFPLNQRLSISDLKIKTSSLNNLPNSLNIIKRDEYEIHINKLEAVSGIFSTDFIVNISGETLFQDDKGINSLKFNQPPKIIFSLIDRHIATFSYQDSGYKIIDAGKNILFENGNSTVGFESILQKDQYLNKIQANFKDIGALRFNNDISGNILTVEEIKSDKMVPSFQANNLVKKSIKLDVEFIKKKPSEILPINAVLEPQDNYEVQSIDNGAILESIKINNIEIFTPLYKINLNGHINSFPKNDLPIGSISLRVEKLDNVLIYLKKYLSNLGLPVESKQYFQKNVEITENLNNQNDELIVVDADMDEDNSPIVVVTQEDSSELKENEVPLIEIEVSKTPKFYFIDTIRNLSKKNAATNEEVAIFDFRKEKNLKLLVNETSLMDIFVKITGGTSDIGVDNQDVVPAKNEEELIIDTSISLDEIIIDESKYDVNVDKNIAPESISSKEDITESETLKIDEDGIKGIIENKLPIDPSIQEKTTQEAVPNQISDPADSSSVITQAPTPVKVEITDPTKMKFLPNQ